MGEGDVQEAETEEFKRAVDRFDQLRVIILLSHRNIRSV